LAWWAISVSVSCVWGLSFPCSTGWAIIRIARAIIFTWCIFGFVCVYVWRPVIVRARRPNRAYGRKIKVSRPFQLFPLTRKLWSVALLFCIAGRVLRQRSRLPTQSRVLIFPHGGTTVHCKRRPTNGFTFNRSYVSHPKNYQVNRSTWIPELYQPRHLCPPVRCLRDIVFGYPT